MHSLDDLPGAELVLPGIADLEAGRVTVNALLVAIGAPRLRAYLALPADLPPEPNRKLYALLGASAVPDPFSTYQSLVRRLISFEHAIEANAPFDPDAFGEAPPRR